VRGPSLAMSTDLPRGTGTDEGGAHERPAFEPLAFIRYGLREYEGGARGLLMWLDYAEREIAMRGETYWHRREAWCDIQNANIAEHGAPAFIPLPPYEQTGVSP